MENTREAYRQKMEAQLAEWTARIGVLKAKAAKATAESKIHLQEQANKLAALEQSAKLHLQSFEASAATAWDEMKSEVAGKWDKVHGALEAIWAKVS